VSLNGLHENAFQDKKRSHEIITCSTIKAELDKADRKTEQLVT
jgi:hypothetical protein